MQRFGWLFLLLALLLAACGTTGGSATVGSLTISGAWARAAVSMGMGEGDDMHGGNGAAFMVIENKGASPDRLVKVESDASKAVEIHKTEMKDDIMTMAPVDGVEIPANGKAELKPGGFHVMLIGLNQDLKAGEKVHLKLTFESGAVVDLDAEIRAP